MYIYIYECACGCAINKAPRRNFKENSSPPVGRPLYSMPSKHMYINACKDISAWISVTLMSKFVLIYTWIWTNTQGIPTNVNIKYKNIYVTNKRQNERVLLISQLAFPFFIKPRSDVVRNIPLWNMTNACTFHTYWKGWIRISLFVYFTRSCAGTSVCLLNHSC